MTHQEKIDWMIKWAHKHQVVLTLEGECGIGRACVGILKEGSYPDYEWYDEDGDWDRLDENGDVWTPPNAYHKHPCVAVLGRGEEAESQLYEWLKWFDNNGFVVESTNRPIREGWAGGIDLIMGKHIHNKMVRKPT